MPIGDSEWFSYASECVRRLAEGVEPWAVPWPCAHEFLAIVTHPRIFATPTSLDLALDQVAAWMETISYEVLCLFGNLNDRYYVD